MADVRIVADRTQRPRGRWDRTRSDIGTCTRKRVRGSAMAACLTPHLPRFIPMPTIHSTRVHRPLEHGYTITIARNNPRHHCRRQLLRISNQARAASLRAWPHLQHKDIMKTTFGIVLQSVLLIIWTCVLNWICSLKHGIVVVTVVAIY